MISNAVAALRDEERGSLVWIAQQVGEEKSVNAALVVKAGDHVEVVAWFGKTWGTPIAAGISVGGAGRIKW